MRTHELSKPDFEVIEHALTAMADDYGLPPRLRFKAEEMRDLFRAAYGGEIHVDED